MGKTRRYQTRFEGLDGQTVESVDGERLRRQRLRQTVAAEVAAENKAIEQQIGLRVR